MCFGHEKKPSKRPQIKAMTHCVFLRPRESHVNGGWSAQSFLAQRGELGTGPEECPCAEETQIEAGSQLAGAGVSPAVFLSKSPDKIEKGYRYG